jgi:hypothetical protein
MQPTGMMHRARQHSRLRDIQESQHLLLELATSEPTILQCFRVIESTCLSQVPLPFFFLQGAGRLTRALRRASTAGSRAAR